MPTRPKPPCPADPRCPHRQGSCPVHAARPRPALASRRYVHGSEWRRISRAVIAMRGNVCENDGEGPRRHPRTGKRDPLVVDHRLARKDGGTNDLANLKVVHASEHSRKTALVDGRWGRR